MVAPVGTPEAIIKKLNEQINYASTKDPLKTRLSKEGAQPYTLSPIEVQKLLADELKTWKNVIKASALKIE